MSHDKGCAHHVIYLTTQARARDSPVIVVATHADSLPQASYRDSVARLQSRLRDLYSRGTDSFAYARICSVMHVVNCKDCRHMEQLRNYIYNTAIQYCPPRKYIHVLVYTCTCTCTIMHIKECVCPIIMYVGCVYTMYMYMYNMQFSFTLALKIKSHLLFSG